MSHIVEIKTEVRDAVAVQGACRRLNLSAPQQGIHQLFTDAVEGLAVRLPEWKYPVVCDLANGRLRYDNFAGRWGEAKQLDRFLQAYTVEMATLEARREGHSVTERPLENGSVKLTIQVGGGAA